MMLSSHYSRRSSQEHWLFWLLLAIGIACIAPHRPVLVGHYKEAKQFVPSMNYAHPLSPNISNNALASSSSCDPVPDNASATDSVICPTSPGDPSPYAMHAMARAFAVWNEKRKNETMQEEIMEMMNHNSTSLPLYLVPVYFHILACNETIGVPTNEQLVTLMDWLNHGFQNTSFYFMNAGQTVSYNEQWCICNDVVGFKQQLRVGDDGRIFNVYLCNSVSQGEWGYAFTPPDLWAFQSEVAFEDGIVTMNPAYNVSSPDTYTNIIHETGHWLGLMHTFGPFTNNSGCSPNPYMIYEKSDFASSPSLLNEVVSMEYFVGDGVRDTPAQENPSWDWPGGYDCWKSLDPPLNTCRDIPGIDPGVDPVNNFMNYIPGHCMESYGQFTPDQNYRMIAEYEAFRITYHTSNSQFAQIASKLCLKQAKQACQCSPKCARQLVADRCNTSYDKALSKQIKSKVLKRYKKASKKKCKHSMHKRHKP